VDPINAGFHKHFKYRLVGVKIVKVIQYTSLNNLVAVNTAKAITVSVQRGATVTTEAVRDRLSTGSDHLILFRRAGNYFEVGAWDGNVMAKERTCVVFAIITMANHRPGRLASVLNFDFLAIAMTCCHLDDFKYTE